MTDPPPIVQMRPDRCKVCDVGYAALQYTLDAAVARGYDVTDLAGNLATREDLERTISEKVPIFFHAFGHGNQTTLTGQDTEVVLQAGLNEETCAGMIVYLLSCLTGVSLGPAIIDAGGWAYIGYTVEWTWVDEDGAGDPYLDKYAKGFYESSNTIVIAFLDGLTAKEAKQAGYDKYTEWIDYWSKSDDPNASECIKWLIHDRDNCVLLGDENAYTKVATHLLTVSSQPVDGVEFKVDGIKGLTPWSHEIREKTYTITVQDKVYTSTAIYGFDHWEDGSTNPTRIVNLTSNVAVTASYVQLPSHTLTVNSSPVDGVEFTINDTKALTPFSQLLEEASYTLTVPSRTFINGVAYDFLRWEDGSTDTIRTLNLTTDITVTAFYEKTPKYTLLVDSEPFDDVPFTIDNISYSTPIILKMLRGTHTVAFPQEVTVNGQRFGFVEWEDGSRDPTRTLELTSDTSIVGYYETGLSLKVESKPVKGVPVAVDGYSVGVTPATVTVSSGNHTVSVPEEVEI